MRKFQVHYFRVRTDISKSLRLLMCPRRSSSLVTWYWSHVRSLNDGFLLEYVLYGVEGSPAWRRHVTYSPSHTRVSLKINSFISFVDSVYLGNFRKFHVDPYPAKDLPDYGIDNHYEIFSITLLSNKDKIVPRTGPGFYNQCLSTKCSNSTILE